MFSVLKIWRIKQLFLCCFFFFQHLKTLQKSVCSSTWLQKKTMWTTQKLCIMFVKSYYKRRIFFQSCSYVFFLTFLHKISMHREFYCDFNITKKKAKCKQKCCCFNVVYQKQFRVVIIALTIYFSQPHSLVSFINILFYYYFFFISIKHKSCETRLLGTAEHRY